MMRQLKFLALHLKDVIHRDDKLRIERWKLSVKQLGMRPGPHKNNRIIFNLINQQKISANMTFPMVSPIALQGMVEPFSAKRCIVCDEQQHRFFEAT